MKPRLTPLKQMKVKMKNFFKTDTSIGVSKFRFYLLRFFYAIIVLLLGVEVWSEIFNHEGFWKPLPAVAFSFWAAFSALAILGVLHPLRMIPLLLVQFSYKLIWLIIVAYPLWSGNQLSGSDAEGLAMANFIGIFLDILVIPWHYVLRNFVLLKKQTQVNT